MAIVIAHIGEDAQFVKRVAGDIGRLGFAASIHNVDESTVTPTKSEPANGQLFLMVLSPRSVRSDALLAQVREILHHRQDVRVVPLLAAHCPIPSILGLRVPVDFTGYDQGIADLVAQLDAFSKLPWSRPSANASSGVAARRFFRLFQSIREGDVLHFRHGSSRGAGLENVIRYRLSQDYPECRLDFFHGARHSGIDMYLCGGRDATRGPWLIQFKLDDVSRRVSAQTVDDVVFTIAVKHNVRSEPALVCDARSVVDSFDDPYRDAWPNVDCWRMDPEDMRVFFSWLDSTRELGERVVQPVEQARERYSDLVDKKLLGPLSEDECREMSRLEGILDADEESFYEPAKVRLSTQRASLLENRYSSLIDKKFGQGLTDTEEEELSGIARELDNREAEYYAPIKSQLREALRRYTR